MHAYRIFDLTFKSICLAALIALYVLWFNERKSLVYVDAQKLMINYKGMQEARSVYEQKSKLWYARVDTLKLEIHQLEEEISKTNPSKRRSSQDAIDTKKQEMWNYENVVREKIQNEDQLLTKDVLAKVNDFIKRYGQDKGYDIILTATQYGNIAFAKEGLDVTDEVLNSLNQEYSEKR